MIYFIILFLLLFFVYYYDYARHKKNFGLAYWGICFILIVVAGLRYRIGNDTVVYEYYYDGFPKFWELFTFNFSSTRFEPGFIVLSSITRSFSSEFFLFQLLHAAIVNFVIFRFVLQKTQNRFFCILLYCTWFYFIYNTEHMREALAVCCLLLAWPSFRDGKWLKYYLWAILATFFHTSALLLLLLPICWLPGLRWFFTFGTRTIFIGLAVFAVGFVVNMKFYDLILLISVSERMTDRALNYASGGQGGNLLNILGMVDIFIKYALYPILSLFLYRNHLRHNHVEGKKKVEAQKLEFMVVWQIYVVLLGMTIFILTRYTNYFSMFAFVMMSTVFLGKIDLKKKVYKLRPVYWCLLYLPFFLSFTYHYVRPVNKARSFTIASRYYPYTSVLNPERDKDREAELRYNGHN